MVGRGSRYLALELSSFFFKEIGDRQLDLNEKLVKASDGFLAEENRHCVRFLNVISVSRLPA